MPGLPTLKFAGKFYPLRLAARKCSGGLASANLAQAHIMKGLELARQTGNALKKLKRLIDGHL